MLELILLAQDAHRSSLVRSFGRQIKSVVGSRTVRYGTVHYYPKPAPPLLKSASKNQTKTAKSDRKVGGSKEKEAANHNLPTYFHSALERCHKLVSLP